jgi:hypothetical protein
VETLRNLYKTKAVRNQVFRVTHTLISGSHSRSNLNIGKRDGNHGRER